jgi:hypothetical protein
LQYDPRIDLWDTYIPYHGLQGMLLQII